MGGWPWGLDILGGYTGFDSRLHNVCSMEIRSMAVGYWFMLLLVLSFFNIFAFEETLMKEYLFMPLCMPLYVTTYDTCVSIVGCFFLV
jgi:hypothetical protein